MEEEVYRVYRHNPPHLFRPNAVYVVSGRILRRRKLMQALGRRQFFCETVFERAEVLGWELEAWAVLPNHYHFIARAPESASTLASFMRGVHSITAKCFNRQDGTPGRQVWHNYWDTCIQEEKAYLAGLLYVHMNPVRHGLVERAEEYPYCSLGWFKTRAAPQFAQKVMSQPVNQLVFREDI